MHIYIKNTVDLKISLNLINTLNLSSKEKSKISSVLYSMVFHNILDEILSKLQKKSHKIYIINTLKIEPPIKELEDFLEDKIKDHKKLLSKTANNVQKEFIQILKNHTI